MLYTKPMTSITYDDVEAFCDQQVAENASLDYKVDFPNHLENTLAAFANTIGGIVIIGVEADKSTNKPITPIKGISLVVGLSEKVWSIIFDSISPPFSPEVQVCPDNSGSRAVIVIRVPESNATPHATMRNTMVYVRTGDKNKPEELVSMDTLSWLLDRRKKSESWKEELMKRSVERFGLFVEKHEINHWGHGIVEMVLSPSYPSKAAVDVPELRDMINTLKVADCVRPHRHYPTDMGQPRLTQEGFSISRVDKNIAYFSLFEANIFGQVVVRESIGYVDGASGGRVLGFHRLIGRLYNLYQIAEKLYGEIGYWGHLDLRFRLSKLRGLHFACLIEGTSYAADSDDCKNATRDSIDFARNHSYTELKDSKVSIVKNCCRDVAFEFNVGNSDEIVDAVLQSHGVPI